jgi:hypothetical protein
MASPSGLGTINGHRHAKLVGNENRIDRQSRELSAFQYFRDDVIDRLKLCG